MSVFNSVLILICAHGGKKSILANVEIILSSSCWLYTTVLLNHNMLLDKVQYYEIGYQSFSYIFHYTPKIFENCMKNRIRNYTCKREIYSFFYLRNLIIFNKIIKFQHDMYQIINQSKVDKFY